MRKTVCGVAVLCLSVLVAPAYADDHAWEAYFDLSGLPRLAANPIVQKYDDVQVYRCPSGGACDAQPLPGVTRGSGSHFVDLSGIAPGDVFESRFSLAGDIVETRRTPAWLGSPALVQPPSLEGGPRVGATMTATAAQWSGGWAAPWDATSSTSLVLCPTPAGNDCLEFYGATPIVLEPGFQGWYAFAISTFSFWRSADGSVGPALGYPAPIRAIERDAIHVASAPVGPIAAVPVPVAPAPAPPTASIRARALRRNGALSIARVTCPAGCTVALTVSSPGRKTLRRTLKVTGTKALTIPPRHGKLKVKVTIDGKVATSGTSRAR